MTLVGENKRVINLVGKTYGNWTVISIGERIKDRHIGWLCECVCGVVRNVSGGNLRRGGSLGCGCAKERLRKRPFESIYNSLVREAKRRGYPVEITYEDFLAYTNLTECHYCERPLLRVSHNVIKRKANRSYLDRKDNSVGYSKDNLVVCCPRCNRVKSELFTYEQFKQIAVLLKEFDNVKS